MEPAAPVNDVLLPLWNSVLTQVELLRLQDLVANNARLGLTLLDLRPLVQDPGPPLHHSMTMLVNRTLQCDCRFPTASVFGQALSDITFFLATSINTEVRRAHEDMLIKSYHDALVAGGVHNYSLELCKHDYKIQLWRSFIQVDGFHPRMRTLSRIALQTSNPLASSAIPTYSHVLIVFYHLVCASITLRHATGFDDHARF